jgi:Domain of Unknown Function (DUF1206)
MPTKASGKAEQAGDSASLELVARAGLVAYGVVHLLIGWLAVQIAWSASDSKSADSSGAENTRGSAVWQVPARHWPARRSAGARRRARPHETAAGTGRSPPSAPPMTWRGIGSSVRSYCS